MPANHLSTLITLSPQPSTAKDINELSISLYIYLSYYKPIVNVINFTGLRT